MLELLFEHNGAVPCKGYTCSAMFLMLRCVQAGLFPAEQVGHVLWCVCISSNWASASGSAAAAWSKASGHACIFALMLDLQVPASLYALFLRQDYHAFHMIQGLHPYTHTLCLKTLHKYSTHQVLAAAAMHCDKQTTGLC